MAEKRKGANEKRPMPYKIWPPIQTPELTRGDTFESARAKWLEYLNRYFRGR